MIHVKQEFFLDTSDIVEIERWKGVVRGVTTNQLIMYKEGVRDIDAKIREICDIVPGYPVSVELMDSMAPTKDLIAEAVRLNELAENVVIKVPITDASLVEPYDPKQTSTKMIELVGELVSRDIAVNVTAMMTDMQMKLAVAATQGSKRNCFVSLFYARSIDDHSNRADPKFIETHPLEYGDMKDQKSIMGPESRVNSNPGEIVKSVRQFIGELPQPRIIVGSIRHVDQVEEAFDAGAHIVTVTPTIMRAGLYNRTTIKTCLEFDAAGRNILGK